MPRAELRPTIARLLRLLTNAPYRSHGMERRLAFDSRAECARRVEEHSLAD